MRRQLLADVSHELTTPVTAMRGYLETLTMPELTLDAATRVRYLTIIGDETRGSSGSSAICWIWRGSKAAAGR